MLQLKWAGCRIFPFIDAPDERFIKDGFTLCCRSWKPLTERGDMTDTGRKMARLPVADSGCSGSAQALREAIIAAARARARPPEKQQAADEKTPSVATRRIRFLNPGQSLGRLRRAPALTQECAKKNPLCVCANGATHRQLHLMAKELGLQEQDEAAGYDAVHKSPAGRHAQSDWF